MSSNHHSEKLEAAWRSHSPYGFYRRLEENGNGKKERKKSEGHHHHHPKQKAYNRRAATNLDTQRKSSGLKELFSDFLSVPRGFRARSHTNEGMERPKSKTIKEEEEDLSAQIKALDLSPLSPSPRNSKDGQTFVFPLPDHVHMKSDKGSQCDLCHCGEEVKG